MVPTSLKISNFTSYGQEIPVLDFNNIHMAAISGYNGAGKSSLLDSITWCLWGTSRLGDSSDPLIRLGQNEMQVELSFELDGHTYTVKRKRSLKSGGTTSLEFFSGSHNLTEGTIKATQQKIIDTLHLTFDTFINSAFLRQGHADEFTTKGATERKKILADILGLSHYDLFEEKAKERAKEAQNKLQLLEYQLLEVEAELALKDDQENKKKIAEEQVNRFASEIAELEEKLKLIRGEKEALNLAQEQRGKLLQNYKQSTTELQEIMLQGKKRKERINELKSQIQKLEEGGADLKNSESIQKEKEELDIRKQQRLELEKELSKIQGSLDLKKQKHQQLEKELAELEHKLQDLDKEGAKCPTCGQEIGKANKDQVKKQLNGKINPLKKELDQISTTKEDQEIVNLNKQLDNLAVDPKRYQELVQELAKMQQFQKQKEELIEKKATLATEEKTVLELRDLYQNKKNQVDKMKGEVDKLPDLSLQISKVNDDISQKESEINTKRGESNQAQKTLGQITELISRREQMANLYTQRKAEKDALKKDKEAFDELALAFGKKGIQAMIIENAIPEIEEEANKILDRLTDGRMKIRLETQKETKSKTTVETLDILISDEMGNRPYESYSGGEQFRVNLAIRLALSKLLTHRAGAKLQFLVIDEGFGTQDNQGISRIVESLNAIKDDFEKILVITHLDELKEEFPVRIEVSKGPGGSTFQIIGT